MMVLPLVLASVQTLEGMLGRTRLAMLPLERTHALMSAMYAWAQMDLSSEELAWVYAPAHWLLKKLSRSLNPERAQTGKAGMLTILWAQKAGVL
mmetsp:Transcript_12686/g.16517  ORF Transcript_12686/g.16517 Transcript_12686/m.16517 type:complete len:94 (-) Transcript_12686:225-506(-)